MPVGKYFCGRNRAVWGYDYIPLFWDLYWHELFAHSLCPGGVAVDKYWNVGAQPQTDCG